MKNKQDDKKKENEKLKRERFWKEVMGTNRPRYERRKGAVRQK